MKKLILASALTCLAATAMADSATMVFKTTDGASHSIAADGLAITFTATDMVATAGSTTLTLPLSTLATMEFSGVTSDAATAPGTPDGTIAVTAINGTAMGTYATVADAKAALAPGIYIIAYANGLTSKLIVR